MYLLSFQGDLVGGAVQHFCLPTHPPARGSQLCFACLSAVVFLHSDLQTPAFSALCGPAALLVLPGVFYPVGDNWKWPERTWDGAASLCAIFHIAPCENSGAREAALGGGLRLIHRHLTPLRLHPTPAEMPRTPSLALFKFSLIAEKGPALNQ